MKNRILTIIMITGLLIVSSCKDSLDYTPTGVLSSADLTSPTAIDGLVTSAYAAFVRIIGTDAAECPHTVNGSNHIAVANSGISRSHQAVNCCG